MRAWAMSLCVVLMALAGPVPADAQSIGRELGDAGRDVLRVWGAPLYARSEDLPTIAAVTGGAVLVGALDGRIQDWVGAHHGSLVVRILEPFREDSPLGRLGLAGTLLPISGLLFLTGIVADDRDLRDAGIGCATVVESSSLLRHAIYLVLSRPRPLTGEGPYEADVPGGDWEHRSFFGGHAANVVGCAAFWDRRFRLGARALPLHALAVGVSLSRVVDGAHWASDTYVGMAFGYAAGKLVADRMRGRVEGEGSEGGPVLEIVIRRAF